MLNMHKIAIDVVVDDIFTIKVEIEQQQVVNEFFDDRPHRRRRIFHGEKVNVTSASRKQ